MYQRNEKAAAERIREQYVERGESKLDRLKKLDEKVKRPAEIFAYVFGIVGALVLGTGMCLAMKIIGDLMAVGIVVGLVGIAMVAVNYYLYNALVKARKKKYAQQILSISDELLNKPTEE